MGRSLETQIDTVVQAIRALRPPREIARTAGLPLERVLDIWDALALASDRRRAAGGNSGSGVSARPTDRTTVIKKRGRPPKARPAPAPVAQQSAQDLVTRHLGIAGHVACKLYRTHPAVHMIGTLDDVIQVARLGLIDAARLFKPEAGVKFTTYAPRRIRGAILDAARESGIVKVPRQYQGTRSDGPLKRIAQFDEVYDPPHKGRGPGASLEDCELVEVALEKFGERTATILVEYFGLRGRRPRTLHQIADSLGLSESRVSQIMGPAWRRFVRLLGGTDDASLTDAHRAVVPVNRRDPVQPHVGEYHTCNACGTEHEPDEWRRRGKMLACRRCGTVHKPGEGAPSTEQIERAKTAILLDHEANGYVEGGWKQRRA